MAGPENARQPLATPREISEYLVVPEKTLTEWRYLRKGPPFTKVGALVRYRWVDVETWLENQPSGGESPRSSSPVYRRSRSR